MLISSIRSRAEHGTSVRYTRPQHSTQFEPAVHQQYPSNPRRYSNAAVRSKFGVDQGKWQSPQWVAFEVGVDVDLAAAKKR